MAETRLNVKGGSFLVSQMKPDQAFTPEDFTDEHRMIGKTAKQFIEREVECYREDIENQDFERVVEILHKAGELGLLAHSIPEAYGGLGLDKVSKGLVGEVIGGTSGYGVAHNNHTCIATLPITYFGNEEQKQRYLPKLASGEYLGAYCLTEPSSGSDALSAKTTAYLNPEKTHYTLNGTKIFITNAAFSDTFIVYAKVDGDKFSAFIVEKGFPGLSLGPEEQKMGIKGSSTRSVILEDCQVPIENLLGEVGRGHVIALNVLNLGRFNLGSACMGASKQALTLALQHTNERQQFGRRIAEFGATKEKVAKLAARIYAAESLQYRTAKLIEDALGDLYEEADKKLVGQRMMEYSVECAICKVYGSETLDQVVDESVQLHGGSGFIKEYQIEQMYRDSRINRIFEGTNEINRLIIPGTFFKKAVKEDLSVQEAMKKAQAGVEKVDTPRLQGPLARELEAVKSIRQVFLILSNLIYERFGTKIDEEQETVMKLSDIAITLYATESAVLRSVKAIEKNGVERERLKEQLASLVVDEALIDVEMCARRLLSGLTSDRELSESLQLVHQQLGRALSGGAVERNRKIAANINEAGQYTC